MKKILFSATMAAMLLASCQEEMYDAGSSADDVLVSLNATTPDVMALTRAYGDKTNSAKGALTNVDWTKYDLRYMLEIYTEDGKELVKDREIEIKDTPEDATFNLRLTPNRTYKFVLWADAVNQGDSADLHYNTESLNDIKMKDEAINDETRDAYFLAQNVTVTDNMQETLTLRRPFGKLRVVTTDLADLKIGTDPEAVKVEYSTANIASFSAITGALSTTEMVNKEFTADLVAGTYEDGHDAEDGKQTLFVDYIFGKEGEQTPVNFTLTAYEDDAMQTEIRSYEFDTQIPVQRNYLTTILGNVLTTATEFTITIDEAFENEIIEPMTDPITVTPQNIADIDFTADMITYKFVGDFTDERITITTPEGLYQGFDGSEATFAGQLQIQHSVTPLDHQSAIDGKAQTGKYTYTNITAKELSIAPINTTVKVANCTLESLDFHGGNVQLIIENNTINGNGVKHKNYTNPAAGIVYERDPGVYIYVAGYDLTFNNNSISNTLGGAVVINGWALNDANWGALDYTNNVSAFAGNSLEVTTEGAGALSFMGDYVYNKEAGSDAYSQAGNDLITLVEASNNTFTKRAGIATAYKYSMTEKTAWTDYKSGEIDAVSYMQVTVTPATLATTTFDGDGVTYAFSGDFTDDVAITTSREKTQIFDGKNATFAGQVKVLFPGGVLSGPASMNSIDKAGNYTFQNFTTKELGVGLYCATVNIINNNAEFIDYSGGKVTLKVSGNKIDGKNEKHDRVEGTSDYGMYFYMVDYELEFSYNEVKNTQSHLVVINGRESEEFKQYTNTNEVKAFSNNTLEVLNGAKDNRAALKIWDDETYAPASSSTFTANGQALIDMVNAGNNTITKAATNTGTSYKFDFYDATGEAL